MGNHSVVMVTWSAIDEQAQVINNADGDGNHRQRAADVARVVSEAMLRPRPIKSVYIPPAGEDGAMGGGLEAVVVFHIKNLLHDRVFDAIRSLPWQYPEDVCVIWKDEHAETFTVERPLMPSPSAPTGTT